MASRQAEKERRKRERLERERAEAAAAKRKQRLQIVGGVVVAAAIIVGVVVLLSAGGKSDKGTAQIPSNTAPIPAQKITDLAAAAKAAKCTLSSPPIEGREHVTTKVKYKTNPPTSGNHAPTPQLASDGSYVGAGYSSPEPERYVHSLEHGRVIIQFKPGLAARSISQLETLFSENSDTDFGLKADSGGFQLFMANNTNMPYEVAATAWGQMLACQTFNQQVFDAIRDFRKKYILKGPEVVPQAE
ncbi:MAG: hypothetical protein QOG15_3357 [Solirubrobacteraceae bacterium]|jgi:type IV secretory pathway VirB10-like protein|nr:hypothetical protein [Solirubrobacteraceae bacterium]